MPLHGSAPAQGPESCPQGCHFKLKKKKRKKRHQKVSGDMNHRAASRPLLKSKGGGQGAPRPPGQGGALRPGWAQRGTAGTTLTTALSTKDGCRGRLLTAVVFLAESVITRGSELDTRAGGGWVFLWGTLRGWVLVMSTGAVSPSPGPCCAAGVRLSRAPAELTYPKNFFFNVVQYFFPQSQERCRPHQSTLLQPTAVLWSVRPCQEQSPSAAPHPWVICSPPASRGWGRSGGSEGFLCVSPGFAPHEVIFPGTSVTALGPGFVAVSVRSAESSPGRQSLY